MTQTTNDKPKMVTVPQLIAMQYLPARATRRLINEGKVKSVKVGTRRYVCISSFEQYLASGDD